MRKVISTHEDRKKVVFWDSVDDSEATEASTTFTGLRFTQITLVLFQSFLLRRDTEHGPMISNKEDAMKELGIESQYLSQSDGGVTRRVSKVI